MCLIEERPSPSLGGKGGRNQVNRSPQKKKAACPRRGIFNRGTLARKIAFERKFCSHCYTRGCGRSRLSPTKAKSPFITCWFGQLHLGKDGGKKRICHPGCRSLRKAGGGKNRPLRIRRKEKKFFFQKIGDISHDPGLESGKQTLRRGFSQ